MPTATAPAPSSTNFWANYRERSKDPRLADGLDPNESVPTPPDPAWLRTWLRLVEKHLELRRAIQKDSSDRPFSRGEVDKHLARLVFQLCAEEPRVLLVDVLWPDIERLVEAKFLQLEREKHLRNAPKAP